MHNNGNNTNYGGNNKVIPLSNVPLSPSTNSATTSNGITADKMNNFNNSHINNNGSNIINGQNNPCNSNGGSSSCSSNATASSTSLCNGNSNTSNGNSCNNNSHMNSNNSNNINNNNNSTSKNRICRDFVRGLCRRKHCRYPHVLSPDLVVFCHDFQNASCPRVNCKFLHYTLQEEEYYRKYGEFPQDFLGDGCVPCKERIISGNCRHRECYLSTNESMWNGPRPPPPYRSNDCPPPLPPQLNDYRTPCEEFKAIKRSSRDVMDGVSFKRFREETERIDIMAVIRHFEEEQVMLRRRVEANEIKIAELRALNEYLMQQNTQLRLNNVQHQQQQQQCSNVVNPVTVTQTNSQPPQTPQVMGGVSIAPVQVQATPIVSIAAPPTQIIASASAAPLAIAANTSQGQQLAIAQQNITSLSNTSQPLAPTHAQQILGTSQITLAPALTQGPSMGLTINTSQALAMSNATQPIISYPVMTHSILPH